MGDEQCDLVCLELPRAVALRDRRLSPDVARVAANRARALADPTRIMLAVLLHDGGSLCVCDLAWLMGRAVNVVSHHLKVLRLGKVVQTRKEGKLVLYSLTPHGQALVGTLVAPIVEEVPA